jgi:hypothetical protein
MANNVILDKSRTVKKRKGSAGIAPATEPVPEFNAARVIKGKIYLFAKDAIYLVKKKTKKRRRKKARQD